MYEPLLHRKKASGDVIFELDYSGQDVGGTNLRDKVTGLALQSVVNKPNGSPAHGVIDHATYGRCFQFNGYSYAYGTGVLQTLPLNQTGSYQIDIEFANLSNGAIGLFETGSYGSGPLAGSAIILGQTPSQFLQWFQVNSGGAYTRYQLPEADPRTMRAYRIKRTAAATELKDMVSNVTLTWSSYITGADDHLWLGAASNKGTPVNFFYGMLKSLKIIKI